MNFQWYHITLSTYGNWLPGDPRGFRTRHHREHVEGDYQSPPSKGTYEKRYKQSKTMLLIPPRKLTKAERKTILHAFVYRLQSKNAVVAALAVGATHVHVIVKYKPADIRGVIGDAKRHAWHVLYRQGTSGRLWAKRSRAERIRNRPHQLNAVRYVLRHQKSGAAVWRYGDPIVE